MDLILYLLLTPFLILFFIVYGIYSIYYEKKIKAEKEAIERQKVQKVQIENFKKQRKADERKKMLVEFREKIFPLSCQDLKIQKIWSDWQNKYPSIHDTDEALLEQSKAVFDVVTLLVDECRLSGVFDEPFRSIPVEATLLSCSCPYFHVHKRPCRHMYRLFLILSGTEHPDSRIINVSPDLLRALYAIGADARLNYIAGLRYVNRRGCNYHLTPKLEKEIKNGLWVQGDLNFEPLLNRMTKDKILIALTKSGVKGFAKSWTKVRLVDWVITEHKEFLQFMFYDYVHLTLPESALDWAEGISAYRDNLPQDCMILNWKDALIYARERLVETSDDMVASGEYIKSDPVKLDKTKGA